jgi:hypothetical protein
MKTRWGGGGGLWYVSELQRGCGGRGVVVYVWLFIIFGYDNNILNYIIEHT